MHNEASVLSLIIAHPDDESWAFGALLCLAAQAGWPVRILCLTSGEAGVDKRPERDSERSLTEVREQELRAAMAHLGTEVSLTFARLPDAHLSSHIQEARAALRSWWSPDSTLTATWGPAGGYGHRDHVVCYDISREFFEGIDTPVLTAHFPWASAHEVYRTLWRYRGGALVIDDFSAAANHETSRFALNVDKDVKVQLLKQHISQVGGDDVTRFVQADLTCALLEQEHFDVLSPSQYEQAARVLQAADNKVR